MLTTVKPPALAVHLPPSLGLSAPDKLPPRKNGSDRGDNDLTNLTWLQNPGVLNSMCTALTGSPHRMSRAGTRSARKPRQRTVRQEPGSMAGAIQKDSDKMVNVILNVRANRKYNGEDALKPPLSFACMIFMAIESSPTKTLPVKEIYGWIQWKFPFYRTAAPGWKNSVRHNLSLNKCFKKVDRGWGKSKLTLSKGGLWTVDPEYRRNLLSALQSSPYHPYHSYFTPPLSPCSSDSSLDSLDPAERDAALTMCMISGGPDDPTTVTPGLLRAVFHDHSYAKCPPPYTVRIPRQRRGLSLAEVAAAAELIMQQEDKEAMEGESSDEGIGGEEEVEDSDDEGEVEEMECDGSAGGDRSLADSGYGGAGTPPALESRCSSMEELGADALLCLAGKSPSACT